MSKRFTATEVIRALTEDAEEESSADENVEESSESEEDYIPTPNSSEGSDDSDGEEASAEQDDSDTWISRDKTVWQKHPVIGSSRRTAANIMHTSPGPTRYSVRNVDSPLSAFQLFMKDALLQQIQKWTNKEGARVHGQNWKDVTESELQKFLGLSILSGVYKSCNESILQLWSIKDGRPIFNKTMARNRFQEISSCMRFDDAARRRAARDTGDKLVPIKEMFTTWEATLQDAYVPGENVTVDEQLLTFRGRVPFKQYIPSKPGKYGIKLWMLADSETSYVYHLQVYTGRQAGQNREQNQGERVVLELTHDLKGSGRNVTADNFFTTLSLAQKLQQQKMTLLGTIRKHRREIPTELVNARGRELLSSLFAFRNDATLVSYCPKKGKTVVLLSSMHTKPEIAVEQSSKKPHMILEYNTSKCGVDKADQMLRMYTTKRMTRRWPMAIFYNMIDISALNAFIVYISLNPDWLSDKKHKRRSFLLQLGKELISSNEEEIAQPQHSDIAPSKKRARCSFCPRDKDKKCTNSCNRCGRSTCKEHFATVCLNCIQ